MDSAALIKDTESLLLEAKRQAANIVDIKKKRDALTIEAEQFQGKCSKAAALMNVKGHLY
jgi:hypothetical protein